uniref:Monoacylglycerol lipase ABHD12 n=1 Tax=Cacopsylla melanoneura TaxID=428564 RepID=A0A8D8VKW0_9HEMI
MDSVLLLIVLSILVSCTVFWYAVCFLVVSLLVKVILLIVFILFVIVPIVYKNSYSIQKAFLFLNFVKWPPNFDLTNPSGVGLEGTRNLYITGEDNVKLGVWHILPASLIAESNKTGVGENGAQWDSWLDNGRPVIVYAHGNSGTRGAGHRVQLYHVLQKKEYHVISFDYRGYGDSSDVPINETGLVQDTLTVYKWVQKRTNRSVFLWGHSLGTGISSHAVSILHSDDNEPAGLVLEAPFNNLKDEVTSHPFARMYTIMPWFDYFFTSPMYENGLRFESDKNLANSKTSILILHAKDDKIIPYELGLKLYKGLLEERTSSNASDSVQMETYESDKHYGHKFICEDPGLPNLVDSFIEKSLQRRNIAS